MRKATHYLALIIIGLIFPTNAMAEKKGTSEPRLPAVVCYYCVTIEDDQGEVHRSCVPVACKTLVAPAGTPVGSNCEIMRGKMFVRSGKVTPARTCEASKTLAR